jgi:hypothetical protein
MSELGTARNAGGLAALGAAVLGFAAVLLLALRMWKGFVRATAADVLDGPGGPVGFGAVSGAVVLAAALAAWRLSERPPQRASQLRRLARLAGVAVCTAVAFGLPMYLVAALPGRNCPTYREGCEYVPGSAPALLACAVTVTLAGWAAYRIHTTRAEQRRAQERERLRKLRKKGKGKSRRAG